MPGIMEYPASGVKKLPELGDNVFGATTTGMDPARRTIDAGKETVSGQLNALLAKESPLMTRARTGAMQTANARGLLNSTMAAGAGEEAAINTALPIANADASIYGTASRDNQAATNTGLQFNAGSKNTASLNNANAANTASNIKLNAANESTLFDKQARQQTAMQTLQGQQQIAAQTLQGSQQMGLQTLQGQQQVTLQGLQAASARELAGIEAQYKTLMQTSASAGQVMATAQQGINDILKDPVLSNDAKNALIGKLQSGLKSQMGVIGAVGRVDLASLLVFPSTEAPSGSKPGPGAQAQPPAATAWPGIGTQPQSASPTQQYQGSSWAPNYVGPAARGGTMSR